MEKKQEEQAKKMRELRDSVERLQRENYRLRAQVKERRDVREKVVEDSG